MNCLQWMGDELKALGAAIEYVDLGDQTLPDGTVLALPPVLMGELGTDPTKKTLLVYGHLDVQPAEKGDGWDTEPWVLTEKVIREYLKQTNRTSNCRMASCTGEARLTTRGRCWAGCTRFSATRSVAFLCRSTSRKRLEYKNAFITVSSPKGSSSSHNSI